MTQVRAAELYRYVGGSVNSHLSNDSGYDFRICSASTLADGKILVIMCSGGEAAYSRRFNANDEVVVVGHSMGASCRVGEHDHDQERRRLAETYELQVFASWEEIYACIDKGGERKEQRLYRQQMAKEYGLPETATMRDIYSAREERNNQLMRAAAARECGLEDTATQEEIDARRVELNDYLKHRRAAAERGLLEEATADASRDDLARRYHASYRRLSAEATWEEIDAYDSGDPELIDSVKRRLESARLELPETATWKEIWDKIDSMGDERARSYEAERRGLGKAASWDEITAFDIGIG